MRCHCIQCFVFTMTKTKSGFGCPKKLFFITLVKFLLKAARAHNKKIMLYGGNNVNIAELIKLLNDLDLLGYGDEKVYYINDGVKFEVKGCKVKDDGIELW